MKYVNYLYLGNDAIHDLTKSDKAKLRIDLRKFNGEQGNITYSTFKVSKFWVDPTYMVVIAASFFPLYLICEHCHEYAILLYYAVHLVRNFVIMRKIVGWKQVWKV